MILNDTVNKIFPLLYSLVKALLIIPHSNAEALQLFSRLALFKTKLKSNLNGETLKRATHLHEAVSSNSDINLNNSLSDFEEENQQVSLNDCIKRSKGYCAKILNPDFTYE